MYLLTTFGTVALPTNNEVQEISPSPALEASVNTVSGGFDRFGTAVAPQQWPQPISTQGVIYDEDTSVTRAAFDRLKALVGSRALLWRESLDNGTQHYTHARLVAVPTTRQIDQWESQPVTMNFELWTSWRGATVYGAPWFLDSGIYLDTGYFLDVVATTTTLASSPGTATFTNGGNMVVTDPVITVTAGSAAITALSIRVGAAHLTYAGTVGAGTALVIDAGAWSVKKGGVNAWSQFAFGTAHAFGGMFEFAPGANAVVVTFTGGSTNSTIAADYKDAWA